MWGRIFAMLICVGLFVGLTPNLVKACSGGAFLTIKGLLAQSDYVVEATVTQVDHLGQNAILRVERYLTDHVGPEYLVLERNNPILMEYVLVGRSSGGDCLGLSTEMRPGDRFYAFLYRHTDGSYRVAQTLFTSGIFFDSRSTASVYLEGSADDDTIAGEDEAAVEITEAEFLEVIARETDSAPSMPDENTIYPFKAPLVIFTDGSPGKYMLPVDGGDPVPLTGRDEDAPHPMRSYSFSGVGKCTQYFCFAIAPDNLSIAVQLEVDVIGVNWGQTLPGQKFLFSSTSDAIAVWNDCDLNIYTTGEARLGHEWSEFSLINTTSLEPELDFECSKLRHYAAWSMDGRWLAYSDAQGVWLWDVYTGETTPQLLMPTEDDDIPVPLEFSPLGRYIRLANLKGNIMLDLVTHERLPDGLISPDDRILLRFSYRTPDEPFEICSLTPFSCVSGFVMYVEEHDATGERTFYEETETITQAAWQNPGLFLTVTCAVERSDVCAIFQWHDSGGGEWSLPPLISRGHDFAYDPKQDELAILVDPTHLLVNGQRIDLAGKVNGNMINIEWMPSLFYHN